MGQNGENLYRTLYYKHKIYELMFESFPSVTLQIYASLVNDYSLTIVVSIVICSTCIGFNAWMYLVNVTRITTQSSTAKEVVQKDGQFSKVMKDKRLFLCLYGFLVSDLFIRSIPLIMLMASIPSDMWRISTFIIVFVALALFEFVMNTRMRIPKYQRFDFIIQIFAVSILSSFYNLLCTLDLLKNDGFFGKSVAFKAFIFEHKIRIGLSLIVQMINLALCTMNGIAVNSRTLILMPLYFILLAVNLYSMKMLTRPNDESTIANVVDLNKPTFRAKKADVDDDDEMNIAVATKSTEIKESEIQNEKNYDNLDRTDSI